MHDRFTDRVRRVIYYAREEASDGRAVVLAKVPQPYLHGSPSSADARTLSTSWR